MWLNLSNPIFFKKPFLVLFFFIVSVCSMAVKSLEIGYGFRSQGPTFEIGHKFGDSLNVRLGSSEFTNWDFIETNNLEIPSLNDIIFNQSGSIELKQLSALIDYHPWQGDFRLTGGITDNRIIFEAINYGDDEFIFNNRIFSDHTVDSTELVIQLTDGVSPYIGIGWSTGFDRQSGFSFSGDLGFYYAVDYAVNFSAHCSDNATRFECTKIKTSARKETHKLKQDLELLLLPMVGMGFSYKF